MGEVDLCGEHLFLLHVNFLKTFSQSVKYKNTTKASTINNQNRILKASGSRICGFSFIVWFVIHGFQLEASQAHFEYCLVIQDLLSSVLTVWKYNYTWISQCSIQARLTHVIWCNNVGTLKWQNSDRVTIYRWLYMYIYIMKWQWHLHHFQFQHHMASDDSEFKYFQMIPQPGPCLYWWHDICYPSFVPMYNTNAVNRNNIFYLVGILMCQAPQETGFGNISRHAQLC